MKIGIFSGSFNPIHIGHLMLANYIVEFTDLDEVWFIVTPQNPWKKDEPLINEKFRLEMVGIALKGYSKLKACDIEFSLPRPSYTGHTLKELVKQYPNNDFSLIIGSDNWLGFDKWKDSEDILKNHTIYVYPRIGYDIISELPQGVNLLSPPRTDLSSTFIREGLEDKKNMKAFLPEGVYEHLIEVINI